ncbi:hypothetical protein Ancab_021659 [Ancistrocladus abbreviatus]
MMVDVARQVESGFSKSRGVSPSRKEKVIRSSGLARGSRSYKEVVVIAKITNADILTVGKKDKDYRIGKAVQINALKEDLLWLNECYVGETYAIHQVPSLQDQFRVERYFGCLVRPM